VLIFQEPTDAEEVVCPYIDTNRFTQRYAFLKDLSPEEFDMMLNNGWRHFGFFFFIPNCRSCNLCTPVRTSIFNFSMSKSQRRNLSKNDKIIEVEFVNLEYKKEYFEIYKKHSMVKFNQETSEKDFIESFFSDSLSGSTRISLYKYNNKLVAIGFIDISETGISSVYFCYDTDYSRFGLGVYSVLKEIEYGKLLNKSYYYLGYYIKGNQSMEYKIKYTPCEFLDWNRGSWHPFKSENKVLV